MKKVWSWVNLMDNSQQYRQIDMFGFDRISGVFLFKFTEITGLEQGSKSWKQD